MFRRILPITALLIMSGSAALADTPAQARKAIEAIYAKDAAALNRKDMEVMLANTTPDYTVITKQGRRLNRDQAQQLARQLAMAKTIHAVRHITSFSLKGDTAVTRIKSHMVAQVVNPQNNKTIGVTVDGVQEDLWVKRGGRWLAKQSKEISQAQKITGMN